MKKHPVRFCGVCEQNHYAHVMCLAPRKAYTVVTDEDGSSYKMMIFTRSEVERRHGAIESDTDLLSLAEALTGWYRSYNGAGCWFTSEPCVRVLKRSIVVSQICGQDI